MIRLAAVILLWLPATALAQTTCYETRFTIHCNNGLSASKEGRSTYWSDDVVERREGRQRVITVPHGDDAFDRFIEDSERREQRRR